MPDLVDLGHKPTEAEVKEKYYPHIYFYDTVPKEMMAAELGKMIKFIGIGKIVAKGVDDRGNKKSENMTLEVHKIGYLDKAGFNNKK